VRRRTPDEEELPNQDERVLTPFEDVLIPDVGVLTPVEMTLEVTPWRNSSGI
jgi:hypothetical protein